MNNNIFSKYKEEFDKKGYFILKNFIDKKFIIKIANEINTSKNTNKYFDNNDVLRRIEKIYDKGENLILLNNKISVLLKEVFKEDFLIFKDKFNTKPPGGEGFFAHYDGIFHFVNSDNQKKRGWYEYGNFFISALIAIDECNKENGTIELAESHKGDFDELLNNTKKDGTPALTNEIESITNFNLINLDVGDIVIFSNTCPHRSKKNYSNKNRRILYYTYTLEKNGSKYDEYFIDKEGSKNKSKSLSSK